MKKLLFLSLAIGALSTAKAQIQFGVKAGANFTTISNIDDGKTLVGLNGGALVNIPLIQDKLRLQPEVVYSGQGAKYTGGKFTVSYINVPILAQYRFPIGIFVETGPQIGFLLSAKDKYDGGSDDYKDYTKSVDFSWAVGAGYIIPDINLGFDARFNVGATKVFKNDEGDYYSSSRNVVFQLGVFYLFGGGSK